MKLPVNPAKKVISTAADSLNIKKTSIAANKVISRDMDMVPKYLELAKVRNDYRFNSAQVEDLTKQFNAYETKLLKTDLLKELLAIGSEKGEMLSAKEIAGFLKSTSSMKQLEQKNVLEFLKAAKEQEVLKYTPENLKKIFPYEDFKAHEIRNYQGTSRLEHNPDWLDEAKIQERYEIALNNELRIGQNKYYNNARNANAVRTSEYITSGRYPEFVKTVGKSIAPKELLSVIETTGVNQQVINAANELTTAFQISGGNKGLVLDLSRGFYISEIKQIVSILVSETKSGGRKDLNKYVAQTVKEFNDCMPIGPALSTQRKYVLKELGLTDKIKLKPLSYHSDVYTNSSIVAGRGPKLTRGSFEQGKKK